MTKKQAFERWYSANWAAAKVANMPKYAELEPEQQAMVRESFEKICVEKGYGKDDRSLIAFLLGITDEMPATQANPEGNAK